MRRNIRFHLAQLWYDLHTGLLLRPAAITGCLVALALLIVYLGERGVFAASWESLWPLVFLGDAASAQVVLGTLTSAMITVVSIVYSILVMSLTLASMQFSPRILHEFARDRASQTQLGIFIGTFSYCLVVLRSMHGQAHPGTVHVATSVAILLALVSLGYLIYFIHHISQLIQINYIVDIISHQTEEVIRETLPPASLPPAPLPPEEVIRETLPDVAPPWGGGEEWQEPPADAVEVRSLSSGYVQLIDEAALTDCARRNGLVLHLWRIPGDFAVKGNRLLSVSPPEKMMGDIEKTCREAFDIGPVRTMQQDIEFGLRQIVDVALKAVSPAVNDPTTAITCIDHLGGILSQLSRGHPLPWCVREPATGAPLLYARRTTFRSALDLSFNQLRHYGRDDPAVLTAMVRVIGEIAAAAKGREHIEPLREHGELVRKTFPGTASPGEREEFERHWKRLLEKTGG